MKYLVHKRHADGMIYVTRGMLPVYDYDVILYTEDQELAQQTYVESLENLVEELHIYIGRLLRELKAKA